MDRDFKNSATPAEKHDQLLNERKLRHRSDDPRPTSTYRDQANIDLMLEGGRFAAEATVAGSDPALRYPRQDPDGPWSTQNPVEPFINAAEMFAVEPCGTQAEIEEAARILAAQSSEPVAPPVWNEQTVSPSPSVESVEPGSDPQPKLRRLLEKGLRRRPL